MVVQYARHKTIGELTVLNKQTKTFGMATSNTPKNLLIRPWSQQQYLAIKNFNSYNNEGTKARMTHPSTFYIVTNCLNDNNK